VWGWGLGAWGWGLGPKPPTPNPQSPIPNPHLSEKIKVIDKVIYLLIIRLKIEKINSF